LDFDAVTAVIPGAKRPDQVEQNVRPSDLPPLGSALHETLREIYVEQIRDHVHHYW
jgi:aryl-alcohol dehydrogenase-like predicted oxidoreductase